MDAASPSDPRRSMSPLTDLSSDDEHDPVPQVHMATRADGDADARPRKRARRSAPNADADDDDRPHRSRPRKQGRLSLLPAMPMDVLFEILSHLPPADLLSLARTTKPLRALLLDRTRSALWRRSYTHIPGCPSAPRWTSEPAWAALLFGGNYCHMCDARPVRVHPGLLMRICKACLSENLITRDEAKERFNFALDFLLNGMVTTIESKLGPHRTRSTTYWWAADVEQVHMRVKTILELEFIRRFNEVPHEALDPGVNVSPEAQEALDVLYNDLQARATAHKKHAAKFARWQRAVDRARHEVLKSSKKTRKEEIMKRLLAEGFERQDVLVLGNHREVKAEQQLTDRVWKRVHPILVAELTRIKANRLEREMRQRADDRRKSVNALYDRWLTTIPYSTWTISASQREIHEFPEFEAFIETDQPNIVFPREIYTQELKGRLRSYVAGCAKRRYDKLLALRQHTIFGPQPGPFADLDIDPEQPPTPPTLALPFSARFAPATTAFRAGWGETYFGTEVLALAQPRGWRAGQPSVAFEARASAAIGLLLDRLELPVGTTPAELDALDPALVCMSCPIMQRRLQPEIRGRVVYSWRDFATHNRDHDDQPHWRLLTPAEAASCGFGAHTTDEGFACTRCAFHLGRIGDGDGSRYGYRPYKRWAPRTEVVKHLRDVHGVESPVHGEDLVQFAHVRHQARARDSILWSEEISAANGAQTGSIVPFDPTMPVDDGVMFAIITSDEEDEDGDDEAGSGGLGSSGDGQGEGSSGQTTGHVSQGEAGDAASGTEASNNDQAAS
ncbi:hypothetical protein K488DRAFT_81691 [Vararia minispora EC-137]|uniref:Uncharacterized protein n=1 Tax=Vararia minispora EC-137 TaxID=1314806 RepID=A0ACB8QZ63_9AGAM|nr:hypothetical protein K488DRAFT_81691 [Vararia minispora EC-137]